MLYISSVYLASISSVYIVLYTVLYLFYIQCYISDYIHAMCTSVYIMYNITLYHGSIYLLYWCSVMGIYKEYIMGYSHMFTHVYMPCLHMFTLSYLHAMFTLSCLLVTYKNTNIFIRKTHQIILRQFTS